MQTVFSGNIWKETKNSKKKHYTESNKNFRDAGFLRVDGNRKHENFLGLTVSVIV